MDKFKKTLGILLLIAAWIAAGIITVESAVYAIGCVMWLHAPVGKVLLVTVPVMSLLLAVAWVCGRLGVSLRSGT